MPLRRATLEEVQREGKLDGDTKALCLGADEVSVAYYRAGYTPDDYPTESEWAARLLIERSFAIKCPSIGQHLAGTKKVQQVLAAPAMLARFVNPEQAAVLSSCFAGLHGLDETGGAEVERAVRAALDSPEAYVLKPQREGGGNNLYGEEMATALSEMPAAERASYGSVLKEDMRLQPGYLRLQPGIATVLSYYLTLLSGTYSWSASPLPHTRCR